MAIPRGEVIDYKILIREVITPEIAKEMKEHANPNNRRIVNTTVKAYANDMANGNWDASAVSPIVFTKDGVLVEGHHRINAIIESNTPITTYVCEDAEPSFLYNLCLARTKNNILQMKGTEYVSNNNIALINVLGELVFGVNKVSVGEVERALHTDGFTINEIVRIAQIKSRKSIFRAAAFTGAMYCAYHCGVPFSVLEEFAKVVNTGLMRDMTQSSAVILRNQILDESLRSGKHADKVKAFACTQEAIHDFYTKTPRKMSYSGKKATYATQFAEAFRAGKLFQSSGE